MWVSRRDVLVAKQLLGVFRGDAARPELRKANLGDKQLADDARHTLGLPHGGDGTRRAANECS